ncbi:MAG: hypothetical protein SGPRY_008863 [Prymnesium sp.]
MEWRSFALLFSAGLFTRFCYLSHPRQAVGGEAHTASLLHAYSSRQFFLDLHPPLGTQMLALSAWLGGYDGANLWEEGGETSFNELSLFAFRCLPALQGAALPPLLFVTARVIGLSQPASLLAATAVLFDACFLVESRLMLTDGTLLLGIVMQLFGTFSSDAYPTLSRDWCCRAAISGVGIGLAVSTKWAGISTLAVAAFHALTAYARSLSQLRTEPRLRAARLLCLEAAARAFFLVLLPLGIYLLSFFAHFSLLSRTGEGAHFMTPAFRASLDGDEVGEAVAGAANFSHLNFWEKLSELHGVMVRASRDSLEHYSSASNCTHGAYRRLLGGQDAPVLGSCPSVRSDILHRIALRLVGCGFRAYFVLGCRFILFS